LISSLIFVSTGAFVYWTISGYKGTFDDYMSRFSDTDNKYEKNYWTGAGLITLVTMIILGILSK
jgi:hypothetical protein